MKKTTAVLIAFLGMSSHAFSNDGVNFVENFQASDVKLVSEMSGGKAFKVLRNSCVIIGEEYAPGQFNTKGYMCSPGKDTEWAKSFSGFMLN